MNERAYMLGLNNKVLMEEKYARNRFIGAVLASYN